MTAGDKISVEEIKPSAHTFCRKKTLPDIGNEIYQLLQI